MTHIHLDLVGGIAGDMFLAAALDAGLVEARALGEMLGRLGVGAVEPVVRRERRGGLAGTHLRFAGWEPEHERSHRHLGQILELLASSALPPRVLSRAEGLFRRLGEAEAEVHGVALEAVHFHECGALDSIFDLVGAAFVLERVEASWSVGAVPVGQGIAETAHGPLPLPVPATAHLLRGFELVPCGVALEMVTPTGAVILRALGEGAPGGVPPRRRPPGKLRAVGHGLGSREIPGRANVLRLLVFDELEGRGQESDELMQDELTQDQVVRLECEIDDMSPELLPHLEGALFRAGALDVTVQPVAMKKGRMGFRLSALARPEEEERMVEILWLESTTLGVRRSLVERWRMPRRLVEVETPFGPVVVKVAFWKGRAVKVAPEHDVCERLAEKRGVSVREVYEAARAAGENLLTAPPGGLRPS